MREWAGSKCSHGAGQNTCNVIIKGTTFYDKKGGCVFLGTSEKACILTEHKMVEP